MSYNVIGEKVEKNIRYNKKLDTYYVQFNFRDISSLKSFPTLEAAREYRDKVNAEKLRVKTESMYGRIRQSDLKLVSQRVDKDEETYPDNAYAMARIPIENINKDLLSEEGFEKAVNEVCGEKEAFCIFKFFKERETLANIGKAEGMHNVSRERVRQVICKGLRRIRSYVTRYDVEQERAFKKKLAEKDFEDLCQKREELIEEFRKSGVITEDMTVYFGKVTICTPEEEKSLSAFPIDELDLSVRSYNCLRRAGIHNLGQLCEKTSSELLRIRNMGKKSAKEIKQKLAERGLQLASEGEE